MKHIKLFLKSCSCYMSGVFRKFTDNKAGKNKNIKLTSTFHTDTEAYLWLY